MVFCNLVVFYIFVYIFSMIGLIEIGRVIVLMFELVEPCRSLVYFILLTGKFELLGLGLFGRLFLIELLKGLFFRSFYLDNTINW